jgi:hypothetical protein
MPTLLPGVHDDELRFFAEPLSRLSASGNCCLLSLEYS